jgi:hypothetical protein
MMEGEDAEALPKKQPMPNIRYWSRCTSGDDSYQLQWYAILTFMLLQHVLPHELSLIHDLAGETFNEIEVRHSDCE